jgi:hypothetical protein
MRCCAFAKPDFCEIHFIKGGCSSSNELIEIEYVNRYRIQVVRLFPLLASSTISTILVTFAVTVPATFSNMETLLRHPFIEPFEEERQKYNRDHHEPTTHQLNRFSIYCELLRQDPELLNEKKSSTRSRKKAARENLLKISRLSSSIFTLCCFLMVTTELGSKSYLEIILKLREWWRSVKHLKALVDKARILCEIEGVEYVETGEILSIYSNRH